LSAPLPSSDACEGAAVRRGVLGLPMYVYRDAMAGTTKYRLLPHRHVFKSLVS
jgi:hypothetical protein